MPSRLPAEPRRRPPPLDPAALDRLALRYVERFATTRGRLADYLRRKVRERGWADDAAVADPQDVADRMAGLGYVDDRAFAASRAASMTRRGLGVRRIVGAWKADGIDATDAAMLRDDVDARAVEAALAFARRRRIGPWGDGDTDRALREKQIAAMLRAGHAPALARRVVMLPPGDPPGAAALAESA